MLEIGKKHTFNYPIIKYKRDKNIVEYQITIIAEIPSDYDFEYGIDPYFVRYGLHGDNILDFKPLRYYDKPTLRGKSKWTLVSEESTSIKINDLPTSVNCSLNTFEHPSKRKWFKHKNFGFSNSDYEEIDWKDRVNYPLMIRYGDIVLFYNIICDIVRRENPDEKRFEVLKEKISDCFMLNYNFKMNKELLDEYHENYLKDLLDLW